MPQKKKESSKEAELKELKGRFVDLSRRYKEQEKFREWLSYNNANKVEKVSSIRTNVLHRQQTHKKELDNLHSDHQAQNEELEEELERLQETRAELQISLAAAPFVESENARLRQILCRLEDEMEEESQALAAEMERIQSTAFASRRIVEMTQRDVLRQLKEKIRRETFEQMKADCDTAVVRARELEQQLVGTSAAAYAITQRQIERHGRLRRMRIYREVLDGATTLQEKRVQVLQRAQVTTSLRVEEMQRELDALSRRLSDLKSQRQEQAELAARLKLVKGGLRRAEFETLRYRNKAFETMRSVIQAVRAHMVEESLRAKTASQVAKRKRQATSTSRSRGGGRALLTETTATGRLFTAPSALQHQLVKVGCADETVVPPGPPPSRQLHAAMVGVCTMRQRLSRTGSGRLPSSSSSCGSSASGGAFGDGPETEDVGYDDEDDDDDATLMRMWHSGYAEADELGIDQQTVALESCRVRLPALLLSTPAKPDRPDKAVKISTHRHEEELVGDRHAAATPRVH